MKKMLYILAMGIFTIACKEDKKIEGAENQNLETLNSNAESTENLGFGTDSTAPKLQPLGQEAEEGILVFKQNNLVILSFDQRSQEGKIVIDGKNYTLNQMVFTENDYEIYGNGIKIFAQNGSFQDRVGECLVGNFPSVKIVLDEREVNLENVSLKDCSIY